MRKKYKSRKPVKLPKWWWKLKKEFGRYHPTLDHVIAVKKWNEEYGADIVEVHSRPYGILEFQLMNLISFFVKNNIHFEISGTTSYENDDTMLLRMWEEPKIEQLIKSQERN